MTNSFYLKNGIPFPFLLFSSLAGAIDATLNDVCDADRGFFIMFLRISALIWMPPLFRAIYTHVLMMWMADAANFKQKSGRFKFRYNLCVKKWKAQKRDLQESEMRSLTPGETTTRTKNSSGIRLLVCLVYVYIVCSARLLLLFSGRCRRKLRVETLWVSRVKSQESREPI